jgi:hypothetical protein
MRLLILTLLLPGTVAAQNPVYTKPDVELAEPFSQVGSVRELRDGRVILNDSRDRRVVLVDLSKGQVTPIGATGSGPGEYRSPTAVYALLDDSTLVQDPANGRFLIIGPDARPARFFTPSGGNGVLRAIDARGRMYYQVTAVRNSPNGTPILLDSVPVVRYDMITQVHDTIAMVNVARPNVGTSGNTAAVIGVPRPFAPTDDWAVMGDGTLVVVRVSDFHVEIIAPGAPRVTGPPVPFTSQPVTEADKQAYLERVKGVTPTFRSSNGEPVTPPANFRLPDPVWDAVKPPFPSGGTRVTLDGRIWVQRSGAPDAPPQFEIFDRNGRRTGTATFPKRTRLVGFGANSAYAIRTDDDGLQYLQRYKLR